jgi:hypothetical protein
LASFAQSPDSGDSSGDPRFLNAQINVLKKQAESQSREIANLKKTLSDRTAELKNLLKIAQEENASLKAEIKATSAPAGPVDRSGFPAKAYSYRGSFRSEKWFEAAYLKYGPYVATFDGKSPCWTGGLIQCELCLLSRGKISPGLIGTEPPEVGKILTATAKVVQVLKDGEVLASTTEAVTDETIFIHLKGLNTKNLTDGSVIGALLFQYLGPHSYVNKDGVKKTVQGYAVCRPVSRQEFAQVLAKGFVLKDYTKDYAQYYGQDQKDFSMVGFEDGAGWYKVKESDVP